MSSREMRCLQESGDPARPDPTMLPITATMAMFAVIVAAVSMPGHQTHTEEVMLQDKTTDKWAHYQAKTIRRNTDQMFMDLTSLVTSKDAGQATKLHEQYEQEVSRDDVGKRDLEAKTRKLETSVQQERKRANRYDLGEVFLEMGLVITSIKLLSGRRTFWYGGPILGAIGVGDGAPVGCRQRQTNRRAHKTWSQSYFSAVQSRW